MEIDRIYEDYIADLASRKVNKKFLNTDEAHAVSVLSNLFKNAKETVNIYCQNLCGDISNHQQYIDAVKRFLSNPDARLHILLFQYWGKLKESPIWSALAPFLNKQVFIRYQNEGGAKADHITYEGSQVNFAVADGCAYRFESDIKKHSAYGNFNDHEQAELLNSVFFDFFKQGTLLK